MEKSGEKRMEKRSVETTQRSVGIRKRGSVGMERMRRMDEMVRIKERTKDGLYRNTTK